MNEDNLRVSYTFVKNGEVDWGDAVFSLLSTGQSRSDIVRILQCPQNTTEVGQVVTSGTNDVLELRHGAGQHEDAFSFFEVTALEGWSQSQCRVQ
jgi:hypothetical protein